MNTPLIPPMDRTQIAALLPHSGTMVLLEQVNEISDDHITCEAVSHTDPANPLRGDGLLSASAGIEYAAQAIALHGVLNAQDDAPPASAFIGGVKRARWTETPLDQVPSPLIVEARRLSQLGNGAQYAFALSASDGAQCLTGELLVILTPAETQTPPQP